MKKIALLCVICMLVMVLPAAAASDEVTVTILNASQDIIRVDGPAPIDTLVSIQVYNPEKSSSNIDDSPGVVDSGAVQYFGSALSKGGSFTKDVKLNTETGGIFTFVVTVAGVKTQILFPYYPYSLKENYVERLDTETDADALSADLAEIIKVFGFEFHGLYTSSTDLAIAKEVCKQNVSVELANPDDAQSFLDNVLVLNAFNEQNENLLKAGLLDYEDIWAKENAELYADYTSDLKSNAIEDINDEMLSGTYNDFDELNATFEENVLYNLILNNILSGSGHIEKYFEKYSDKYEDAGFDLSLLDSASGKKTRLSKFLGSDATDIAELADDFNTIFSAKTTNNNTSGGGGGGGASSGGVSRPSSVPSSDTSESYVPTKTPVPTQAPVETTTIFADVPETHWGYEAISALKEKGILNGRDNGNFAPNDNVTRAEFVKIIVEAFDLANDGSEISFDDCPADAWYTPYVLVAAGKNIVNGFGGNFNPDKAITREDAAVIVSRLISEKAEATSTFADDAEISDYAKEAVEILSSLGLINGVGENKFAPKENITRAQAAKLVYNVISGGEQA